MDSSKHERWRKFSVSLGLTLILPTPKVISLCYLYRARPACTSVQSDQALYCWLTNFKVFPLISLKMIMESSINARWIIPFKKFGMVTVNISFWWSLLHLVLLVNNSQASKKTFSHKHSHLYIAIWFQWNEVLVIMFSRKAV